VADVVVAASMKGGLHALDATTGRARWSWRGDALAVNDGRVIDTATGKLDIEYVKRLGAFTGSPAWYDGRLIATTATGDVLFFTPQR
jgi:outer membrane protein assembly factor BamB